MAFVLTLGWDAAGLIVGLLLLIGLLPRFDSTNDAHWGDKRDNDLGDTDDPD